MNGNNFEGMIKKYADELIRMSRERMLSDLPETDTEEEIEAAEETREADFIPFEEDEEERLSATDIPGIEGTDFFEETAEEIAPEEAESTDLASFSARVFTGNNAYPVENAKVLVVRDDRLYTFLTTDRNGLTKKICLPATPEANSLSPESSNRALKYTGEVYATGFTPKKNLLIDAVGGSDIVLDVQMSPISEREV